uniref:Uncharacterized protein n=1 Tax=Aquila chrysaetos chrysaetos TaxID=223781 RepID=A0A663DJI3_AQUCH
MLSWCSSGPGRAGWTGGHCSSWVQKLPAVVRGGSIHPRLWGLTTVCGVNGPLVVLDNVKVGARLPAGGSSVIPDVTFHSSGDYGGSGGSLGSRAAPAARAALSCRVWQ